MEKKYINSIDFLGVGRGEGIPHYFMNPLKKKNSTNIYTNVIPPLIWVVIFMYVLGRLCD